MKWPRAARCAACVALLGMLMAPPLGAQEQAKVQRSRGTNPIDVALDRNQALQGQLLTPGGEPVPTTTLTLLQDGKSISQTKSDDQGRFRLLATRGGIYQLATGDQQTTLRAWTAAAAPPGCPHQLIVVQGDVLRGQSGQIPYTQMNPWLVAGVVAAAVAIPVMLSNHRSDRGDGS